MLRFGRKTLIAATLCAASFSYAEDLNLDAGTMTLGGRMGGSSGVAAMTYSKADLTNNAAGPIMINADVDFGYFVADGLLLDFRVAGQFPIGDAAVAAMTTAGNAPSLNLGLNLDYYFATGSQVRPYLGVGTGTGFSFGANNSTAWMWMAGGEVGLLVGLNKNVALDFGANVTFNFPLSPRGNVGMDLQVGYVGVRAFF